MERKDMKKFLRAVRRRLDMPKNVRTRVMDDFICSIQARREDGLSEEAILGEIGTPKQAAAELNAQMKEYTYLKSPWRWACLGLAILSGLCIAYKGLPGLLLVLFNKTYNAAASIGVIGGADGPTAIFVTTKVSMASLYGIYGCIMILSLAGFLLLRRLKRK